MGAGSAQNGSAGVVSAVDNVRPKFALWGSFALATWWMAFTLYTAALALLLDMLMVALKGRRR
jgi:hypothetical protein